VNIQEIKALYTTLKPEIDERIGQFGEIRKRGDEK